MLFASVFMNKTKLGIHETVIVESFFKEANNSME